MESPVMTSASSHRLRSAVSACAHPTHSYLSSSYLVGGSIQCESRDSGGCANKLSGSGAESKSPSKTRLETENHNKRQKVSGGKKVDRRSSRCHVSKNGSEQGIEARDAIGRRCLLDVFPKEFLIGKEVLSRVNGIDGKTLAVILREERVRDSKKRENERISNDGSSELLSQRTCNSQNNNSVNSDKDKSINGENSDQCAKCGGELVNRGEQEISKWQPKHVATRRTARLLRGIRNVWQSKSGSPNLVLGENVQPFVESAKLLSSPYQPSEMLECAKECQEKPSTTCLAREFYALHDTIIGGFRSIRSPPSRTLHKNVVNRKFSIAEGMSKCEVFLGGSCNPTTWRTDYAIPELENMNISYYNPQVEEWRPELLEVEYHAKANATVMFFVIDNQTRGVSALIEVAHLAGNERKLVLVIQSYTQKNQIICDEEISQKEYEDLKSGQEVLQDLVERQGIPVFDDIKVALKATEKVLRDDLTPQDIQKTNVNREKSLDPLKVFNKVNTGNRGDIGIRDAVLALKMLTGEVLSVENFKSFLGNDLNGTCVEEFRLDFCRFCQILEDITRQRQEGTLYFESPSLTDTRAVLRDVYLGGTLENTSWREFAIPKLESYGLTFFVPEVNDGGKRFTDLEASAMESSFVLLFVITSTARSIAAMAIAGHYIGKGSKVVLCVQHLPEGATIDSEELSESAIKDYNRGRMYLMDIATRSGVHVFQEIPQAVDYVIEECKNR